MATPAPEAANRAAPARPILLLPPVTIAARRKRLISIASSQTRVSAVPHSKASEQGYFGRSLLVPYPDAPPMLFSESGVVINSPSIPASVKCWQSELGHPYGLNHKIPPLGEAQMSYSLYDAAVTPCIQQLGALAGIIDKAAAHCAANKIEESALLQDRLYPDMFCLARQIRQSADFA